MEQNNQQIVKKLSLPIKTKIAAWWMIVIGTISLIIFFGGLVLFFSFRGVGSEGGGGIALGLLSVVIIFPVIGISLAGIFTLFIPAIFLFQKKDGLGRLLLFFNYSE